MSLSLSDLLIATFGIPMDFTAALTFGWKMGEAACVFTGFVLTFLGNIIRSIENIGHWIIVTFFWSKLIQINHWFIVAPLGMYCMNILSCIAFYRWISLHSDVSKQQERLKSLYPNPFRPIISLTTRSGLSRGWSPTAWPCLLCSALLLSLAGGILHQRKMEWGSRLLIRNWNELLHKLSQLCPIVEKPGGRCLQPLPFLTWVLFTNGHNNYLFSQHSLNNKESKYKEKTCNKIEIKAIYRVIRWIRTQDQGCCELVLGLMMALKASMWPQDWAQIFFKSETLYNWFNN